MTRNALNALDATSQETQRTMLRWLAMTCLAVNFAKARSQAGQDKLLRRILARIGTTNQYFVEFGFNADSIDGGSGSNTAELYHKGWHGLLLDGSHTNTSINLHAHYISSQNIVELLRHYHVPLAPDYVSIDLDSTDLWVMRSLLSEFQPRVLSVEYNPAFPLSGPALTFPDTATMPILNGRSAWYGTCYMGASARALVLVAHERGYRLVGVARTLDLFFVLDSLWHSEALFGKRPPEWLSRGEHPPYKRAMTVDEAENLMDYEEW
eukprot:CAMPEP_0119305012 /NCGR_PEP_ID=MMETSP1333-20130426/6108_1 /TAXON_ID=418940 /ORGANISM="Scyphosphaera apsteinii, Strain RCC1455" /LENGTH=265 /DNA_ID=CAMNT_0007308009 /DNA_START=120 /DNA_END=914 /DNA_ORIENTATION=-